MLLGELKEFKRQTIEKLDSLDKKVEKLWVWRWKIAGMATAASAIIALVVEVLRTYGN